MKKGGQEKVSKIDKDRREFKSVETKIILLSGYGLGVGSMDARLKLTGVNARH